MGIFSKKLEFRVIDFVEQQKAFDYPKHLPLPRVGELVSIEGIFGRVVEVRYVITGVVSEVRVSCQRT